ncbi:DUF4253 domain-containing protein [Streptomyces europaeiscabiei]|uniref:DUF4253 domain-containing protein n=1 Tax=Streptomyces europaeiscabiei TaxID=146819 RepID=UPI0029A7B1E7|nr:DUF4253 domain-containing protein [Streptomyces europaeiscabiei]MDX3861105.1 DUF4253 domain-containing protein [Streptomyces europaeiscabiei]MDX3873651.1 DUF4253 domain-containing protein [Streptomyces europaeiscabiei]
MATLPNPLPKLAADPSGHTLGLELPLPPGRLIDATDDGPWHEPLLWCADEPAAPGVWTTAEPARRTAGLLPVLVDVGGSQGGPQEWELAPGETSYPGDHDAEDVLAEFWEECAAREDGEWPGLAATPASEASGTDPDALAAEIVDALASDPSRVKEPRLALVPARRSADIPAAIGWAGPMNHERDVARLSAVLRSWEDRFGIRVVALNFAQLVVSVAAPPTTGAEAEAVAAEHFAFCPDNVSQGTADGSLRSYARTLVGEHTWSFWWD